MVEEGRQFMLGGREYHKLVSCLCFLGQWRVSATNVAVMPCADVLAGASS
jgi:hypothetical protein